MIRWLGTAQIEYLVVLFHFSHFGPSKVVSPAKVASFSSHTHLQLEAFAIEQNANSSRKKSALELGPGT
jgi:hypothetical protein